MAVRSALVVVAGQVRELPSGDTLAGVVAPAEQRLYFHTANTTLTVPAGDPSANSLPSELSADDTNTDLTRAVRDEGEGEGEAEGDGTEAAVPAEAAA